MSTWSGQNVGMTIFSPPFMADSWAQSPTMVQLAEVAASGSAGRSPLTAAQEGVNQVRMRPAVASSLEEREVLGVLDGRRLGEPADRLGQEVGIVGHLDPLGDLGLGERVLRRALGVDDRVFVFDLLPLEALLAAGRRRSSRGTAGRRRTGCGSPRRRRRNP